MAKAKVHHLADRALEELRLSAPAASKLSEIRTEVQEAYREDFVRMQDTLRRQASALERIQETLNILVKYVAPKLSGEAPVAFRVADGEGESDLATAVVTADPIGAGYTLSQAHLATALGLDQPTVSVLVRAFKLNDDEACAVAVRQGATRMVNYHPRAVARFREHVNNPPEGFDLKAASSLRRARKALAARPGDA